MFSGLNIVSIVVSFDLFITRNVTISFIMTQLIYRYNFI